MQSETAESQDLAQALPRHRKFIAISRERLQVERQTAIQLRNQRCISDEVLRVLERELDISESQLAAKSR